MEDVLVEATSAGTQERRREPGHAPPFDSRANA